MSTAPRFSALETDPAAIAAFTQEQNPRTEDAFCDARYDADIVQLSEAMEDESNLGSVTRRGKWIYNWHRSAEHPRGLWRRVPEGSEIAHYADWQPVFDLDAFCAEDGEDWHWRGAATLWSDPKRVLLSLSHKGSDQIRHLEWDCGAAGPVQDGFDIAPARSNVSWLDGDTVLLASAAVEDGATQSGWPRVVVKLTRGGALEAAETVFEIGHSDLTTYAYSFPLQDGSRGMAFVRIRNIGDAEKILQIEGEAQVLAAPARTSCSHNETHYAYVASDDGPDPAGTLLLQRLDGTDRRVLFEPSARRAVQDEYAFFTQNFVFWIEIDTLTPTLWRLDLRDPDAAPEQLDMPSDGQSVRVFPFDAEGDGTEPLQIAVAGFLSPNQTWLFDPESAQPSYMPLIQATRSFDSEGMEVRLHLAVSEDGTEVPYHVILPKGHAARAGKIPVLQYGYGGFSHGLSPYYLRLIGPGWLEQGGAYVLSYIRGGNEFGASWHLAAKAEKRLRSYEDFAAIAADLVTRGYSKPEKIACHGGSNGGLLCGVMLTRFPERYGAVWASVGVFDQMRFHLFPAGAGWIDEYSDPDDPIAREWLLEYSPVHNVVANGDRAYPPALIDTNDTDDRVDPSHSRRFAAILQEAEQPTWFYSRAGGHGGGAQTSEAAEKLALGLSFLRHSLNE